MTTQLFMPVPVRQAKELCSFIIAPFTISACGEACSMLYGKRPNDHAALKELPFSGYTLACRYFQNDLMLENNRRLSRILTLGNIEIWSMSWMRDREEENAAHLLISIQSGDLKTSPQLFYCER